MKISFVVSTSPTRFQALTYKDSLEENLRWLSSQGYEGVELAVRDPNDVTPKNIKDLITAYNLTVPAIGTGQAFLEEGLSLNQ